MPSIGTGGIRLAATRTRDGKKRLPIEERFMRHVVEQPDGCWVWTSVTASCGRGLFRISTNPYKWLKAHLAAVLIFRGEERQEGYEGHHTCLNGKCVNPDHIVLMTKAEHRAEHKRIKDEEEAKGITQLGV
jgi:hypothetical protein